MSASTPLLSTILASFFNDHLGYPDRESRLRHYEDFNSLGHVAWKRPKRHHDVTCAYRSSSYPDIGADLSKVALIRQFRKEKYK